MFQQQHIIAPTIRWISCCGMWIDTVYRVSQEAASLSENRVTFPSHAKVVERQKKKKASKMYVNTNVARKQRTTTKVARRQGLKGASLAFSYLSEKPTFHVALAGVRIVYHIRYLCGFFFLARHFTLRYGLLCVPVVRYNCARRSTSPTETRCCCSRTAIAEKTRARWCTEKPRRMLSFFVSKLCRGDAPPWDSDKEKAVQARVALSAPRYVLQSTPPIASTLIRTAVFPIAEETSNGSVDLNVALLANRRDAGWPRG